jgi:hypothetical protein
MRTSRVVLAAALLVLAVLAALVAGDLLRWRDGIRAGDVRFREDPAAARWRVSPLLPLDAARRLLGVGDQVAFRRAVRGFVLSSNASPSVDNGAYEVRERGDVESALTDASRTRDHRRASQASNLLGVLAFTDAQPRGPTAAAPVDRSVADFQDAVRLDPGNDAAKFNLELLLQRLVPTGVRPGAGNSSGGPAHGHRGASAGGAGQGY